MITDLPNEVLPKIAFYLSFEDKFQLMSTCHSLYRVISQRCLYESLAICANCSHHHDPIARYKNPKFNGNQVKRLTLNLNRLSDASYSELTTVFPNVTELSMGSIINECARPLSVTKSLKNWTSTITSIDMEKGYLQLMKLLETDTFRRLEYLSISPYITMVGPRRMLNKPDIRILACLRNAPSLKHLTIFKCRVNVAFLEQIHQSCPLLQSLEFNDVVFLLNKDELPKQIVQATTVLKLNITYDTVVADTKCILLDYIGAKYPNLYSLDFSTSLSSVLNDLDSQIPDLDDAKDYQDLHPASENTNTRNNQEDRNQTENTIPNRGAGNSNRTAENQGLHYDYDEDDNDDDYEDYEDDDDYDPSFEALHYHNIFPDHHLDPYYDIDDEYDDEYDDDYDDDYDDEFGISESELDNYFMHEFIHHNPALYVVGPFHNGPTAAGDTGAPGGNAGIPEHYHLFPIDFTRMHQKEFISTCEAYKTEGSRLFSKLPSSLKILVVDTALFRNVINSLNQDIKLKTLGLFDVDDDYNVDPSEVIRTDEQLKYLQNQKSLTTLSVVINCSCQSFKKVISHSITKLAISLESDKSTQSFTLNWVLSAFPSITELTIVSSQTTIIGNVTKQKYPHLKKVHILDCQTSQNLPKVVLSLVPHLEELGWLISDTKKTTGNYQNNKARERAHCNVDLTGFKLKTFQLFTKFDPMSTQQIHFRVTANKQTDAYILQPDTEERYIGDYVQEVTKVKSKKKKAAIRKMKKFTLVCDNLKFFNLDENAIIEL